MKGEHTPIIIQMILLMGLVLIQLKDSLKFFIFPTIPHNEWRFKKLTNYKTDSIVKGTLEKKLHQDR